jgi:hypothetical protein
LWKVFITINAILASTWKFTPFYKETDPANLNIGWQIAITQTPKPAEETTKEDTTTALRL